tara:strand:+ start:253 stop:387 length:135 start_codon:yes stop_codon:yes gene_type:complete
MFFPPITIASQVVKGKISDTQRASKGVDMSTFGSKSLNTNSFAV